MIKLIFSTILSSLFIVNFAGATPLELPNELFTVENISNEIRSQLNILIGDLQKNYAITEITPSEQIAFKDTNNGTILLITFKENLNEEKTKKNSILEYSTETRFLFKEEINTTGTNLVKTDILKRMFLKDSSKNLYGLESNETTKTVTISVDKNPIVTINNYKNENIVNTIVAYGLTNVFSIKTSLLNQNKTKIIEYISYKDSFELNLFGMRWRFSNPNTANFKVIINQIQGNLTDQIFYSKDNTSLNNLNSFLSAFDQNFYSTYITISLHDAMQNLITYFFPKVEKIKGFSASSRLNDELNLMLIQLDQAKTNPSMLDKVTKKIREINDGIQNGLITITDNRPGAK